MGCRNFEFQHQVFFKCSKTQHKLGGLGVLGSKPYRKMHTDVRFSTSFSSNAAKHKANLVGWAYCVQKHIGNAQCCALSCVFWTQILKPTKFALCFATFEERLVLNFASLFIFLTSFWLHSAQPTKFAMCFAKFENAWCWFEKQSCRSHLHGTH